MKDVYLCFTPYHMLLCSCIALDRDDDIEKEIILIEDFLDADRILDVLKKWNETPFDEHLMVKGKFSVDKIPEKSIFNVFKSQSVINLLKEGIDTLKERYDDFSLDGVFTCNDGRPQSQFLEYKCNKNDGLNVCVEDGSELYGDSFKSYLPFYELVFYKMYYGRWYETNKFIGDYRYTDKIKALKPDLVRDELKHKKIEPINLDNFKFLKNRGLIQSMMDEFDVQIDLDNDNVILFLPHSSFIKKRGQESIYSMIVEELLEKGRDILLKYHPRENDYYLKEDEGKISVLPQSLPSEILILHMIDEPPVVIGDVSTCMLTSKFLKKDIEVISLINLLNIESKNLKEVFRKIGILMPASRSELEDILKNI